MFGRLKHRRTGSTPSSPQPNTGSFNPAASASPVAVVDSPFENVDAPFPNVSLGVEPSKITPVSPAPPILPPIPRVASRGHEPRLSGESLDEVGTGWTGAALERVGSVPSSIAEEQIRDKPTGLRKRNPSVVKRPSTSSSITSIGQHAASSDILHQDSRTAESQLLARRRESKDKDHLGPASVGVYGQENSRNLGAFPQGPYTSYTSPPSPPSRHVPTAPVPASASQTQFTKVSNIQLNEPSGSVHHKQGKTKTLNLLNPMSLLMRRRSSARSWEKSSDDTSHYSRGLSVPAMNMPDDYDPRIRGKGVHDFSAPRIARNLSTSDVDKPSSTRANLHVWGPERQYSSPEVTTGPSRDIAHTPRFAENFDDDDPAATEEGLRRETLANTDFLARAAQLEREQQDIHPAFRKKFDHGSDTLLRNQSSPNFPQQVQTPAQLDQREEGPVHPVTPPSAVLQASTESDQPPVTITVPPTSVLESVPEASPPTSPPADGSPMTHTPVPQPSPSILSRTSPSRRSINSTPGESDRNSRASILPRHLKSNASSRFSFQIASKDSIAQEKLLEQKHTEKFGEVPARRDENRDSRYDDLDDFDEGALDDFDEGGFGEEEIPEIGGDDLDNEFGDDFSGAPAPVGLSNMSLNTPLMPSGLSSTVQPASMVPQLTQDPQGSSPDVLAVRTSTNMDEELDMDISRGSSYSVHSSIEPLHPLPLQPRPSSLPMPPQGVNDDLYFDDGLIEDHVPQDTDGLFDENVFDDPSHPLYQRQSIANNVPERQGSPSPTVQLHHSPALTAERDGSPGAAARKQKHTSASMLMPVGQPLLSPRRLSDSGLLPPPDSSVEHDTASYHSALADAAQRAAADGRFFRQDAFESDALDSSPISDATHGHSSRPSLVPDTSDGRLSGRFSGDSTVFTPGIRTGHQSYGTIINDDGTHRLTGFEGKEGLMPLPSQRLGFQGSTAPFAPAFLECYNTVNMDDDDDALGDLMNDPVIAAANAEALANDDDGEYAREFGFYASTVSGRNGNSFDEETDEEAFYGGFFGPQGGDALKRSTSGRNAVQEPNLTPITERSEFSARNSYISLINIGVPASAASLAALTPGTVAPPGLAQLLEMQQLEDDDITLENLMKLRRDAFGGSNGSLRSRASSSSSNAQHAGMAASSPVVANMQYTLPPMRTIGGPPTAIPMMPSSSAPGAMSSASFGQNMSPLNLQPLPASAHPFASAEDTILHHQTYQHLRTHSNHSSPASGGSPTLTASSAFALPSSEYYEPGKIRRHSSPMVSPNLNNFPPGSAQRAGSPLASPHSPLLGVSDRSSLSPTRPHHSRHSSGHDSITYTREEDSGRWVLERRRTAETGEVLDVERRVVSGGRI